MSASVTDVFAVAIEMLRADNAQHEESVCSSVVCLMSVRVADDTDNPRSRQVEEVTAPRTVII